MINPGDIIYNVSCDTTKKFYYIDNVINVNSDELRTKTYCFTGHTINVNDVLLWDIEFYVKLPLYFSNLYGIVKV